MKLVGMLDSPYLRRTAISLHCLAVPFEHQAVSVFNHFTHFQRINPIVKAPTLVLDNDEILIDSSIIIQYAESLVAPKTLLPFKGSDLSEALQIIGIALAACEKSVQFIYEKKLRPLEKQHEPWLTRVRGQILAASCLLEEKVANSCLDFKELHQAFITTAVAWQFMQTMLADLLPASDYPTLTQLSTYAETLPEFLAFPPSGPGVNPTTT